MKTELTTAQVEFYRGNGFLVIENFLDAAELEHWRETTEAAIAERMGGSKNARMDNQGGEEYYKQVFLQCIKLADSYPAMRELMFNPKLGAMAAKLAGVEGIRIWHDQALFKPPFGNPTAWHLDNPYWSFSSPDSLSIWVALDDATLSNGCLYYLPGTQKSARYETVGIGSNIADLFKAYPQWRELEPIACPCPAGSAVFHNGLTAHGAGANMTNKPRRAMTCAYMPDGSTFNGAKNVLPDEYFASLQPGDLLNDDAITPLIWKS